MKIYYDSIKEDAVTLDCSFTFDVDDDHYNLTSFLGTIHRVGLLYLIVGEMKFTFSSICDRCLTDVNVDFDQSVMQVVAPLGEYPKPQMDSEEIGLSDDEADMYVTPKDHIDIDQFLKEEMFLLTPIKRLCGEDCNGICSVCGALLNNGDCGCDRKVDSEVKLSGLDKLKLIQDKDSKIKK